MLRARLTRIEREFVSLEKKEVLAPPDQSKLERLLQQVKENDTEFEERHLDVLNFIEEGDEETLGKEETIYDEHVNRVVDLTERMERIKVPEEAAATLTTAPDPSGKITKRLRYIEQQTETIATSMRSPPAGTKDHPKLWLQKCQKDIDMLSIQLSGIMGDILSLPGEDAALLTSATTIQAAVSELDFQAVRRLHLLLEKTPIESEAHLEPTVELPKISVPTFDGDVLNWAVFWEQFDTAIHSSKKLHDAQKLAYLRDAVECGPAKKVIQGLAHSAGTYQEAVKCLQQRYDRPRFIHQKHVKTIVEIPTVKTGSGRELRHLHDLVSQHLRSLRTIKGDTFESFMSSLIEMKLDQSSKFAWQQHTHERRDIPSIDELLKFVDWRAQASELSIPRETERKHFNVERNKPRTSYQITTERKCAACNEAPHPLFACTSFQALPHEDRLAMVRRQSLCINCLRHGHFANQCQSSQRCKKCHGIHHTLLHHDKGKSGRETQSKSANADLSKRTTVDNVASNFSNRSQGSVLLMTCQVVIRGPGGSTARARALLDSGSEASFITERLAQQLRLGRRRGPMITCIGGSTPHIRPKGLVDIDVTDARQSGKVHSVQALVLTKITSNTPACPVLENRDWTHLTDLSLADPDYGTPGSVDLLLGADVFGRVVLHGRRFGPSGTPSAFKTQFGWVLTGSVGNTSPHKSCYLAITEEHPQHSDELLKKFWEIENPYLQDPTLSIDERKVMEHFKENHHRDTEGRFIVPLPLKLDTKPLGDSRGMAIRRFKRLERTLYEKSQFNDFANCIREYFELGHAELVPATEMQKPNQETYYMPMHAVHKESSTTTKLRVVFDASAKTTSGSSLNDQFLVGPTVHSSLIDVLLRFRRHKIAMTTDVSKMYRAILLSKDQRDLHRFVWREDRAQPLRDYRMLRLTFGVSASSFAANMALKQNALNLRHKYPRAAKAVLECFFVDDGLIGAESEEEAISLQDELQQLFPLEDLHSESGKVVILRSRETFLYTFAIRIRHT